MAESRQLCLPGCEQEQPRLQACGAGLIRQGADKAAILMKLQANKEVDLRCTRVRGVDFPLAYFIGWLVVFVIGGVGIFDYVIPYVLAAFGGMGGAR